MVKNIENYFKENIMEYLGKKRELSKEKLIEWICLFPLDNFTEEEILNMLVCCGLIKYVNKRYVLTFYGFNLYFDNL